MLSIVEMRRSTSECNSTAVGNGNFSSAAFCRETFICERATEEYCGCHARVIRCLIYHHESQEMWLRWCCDTKTLFALVQWYSASHFTVDELFVCSLVLVPRHEWTWAFTDEFALQSYRFRCGTQTIFPCSLVSNRCRTQCLDQTVLPREPVNNCSVIHQQGFLYRSPLWSHHHVELAGAINSKSKPHSRHSPESLCVTKRSSTRRRIPSESSKVQNRL